MTGVMRETYAQLMNQIDDLEEQIEQVEREQQGAVQLLSLKEELVEKQHELARISDGCGSSHHH